ncbi:hypothetical protein E2562_033497 [Oryza meyeriana var. granulata]|uniref:Uncharacterized protein n=1 Tax=Oryza meyeriana var. granulata TaxID=110450 RepID=A0A6G1ES72_9ORYZ|nr:hypothetical protein E2562_033497 [Oryza meyeriana var. granulata]
MPISILFPGGSSFHSSATCSISAMRHLQQEESALLQGAHVAHGELRANREAGRWQWLGRLAMVSFTTAIGIKVSTVKGLATLKPLTCNENFIKLTGRI